MCFSGLRENDIAKFRVQLMVCMFLAGPLLSQCYATELCLLNISVPFKGNGRYSITITQIQWNTNIANLRQKRTILTVPLPFIYAFRTRILRIHAYSE